MTPAFRAKTAPILMAKKLVPLGTTPATILKPFKITSMNWQETWLSAVLLKSFSSLFELKKIIIANLSLTIVAMETLTLS
ncbi:hypothetical protein [Bdellovibrio sp. ZAP7]|uniref:hypothetical protein n=1 Tax=Bdellovibrio sp. ZAP7 TaxID=2231053 RepID=UPI00143D19FA|nr:hypothetical protein [Bdellovibrio sp. ZAP7]